MNISKMSVVTPSYNQGIYIERTLLSVLNQSFQDFEYLVMDGGSIDATKTILEKYDAKISWVSERDRGQAHAVNKGIEKSKGEIIAWLNSDDIYYPDVFQKVVDYFDSHPDVDVLYGNANHIDRCDKILEPYYTEKWDITKFQSVCFLCQPAVFFRRSVVSRFGLLDESLNFCMDYEYWIRLALGGAKFAYLPETLAGSRLYPENKTLGSAVAVHAEINSMLRKRLGKAPDRWLSNYGHVFLKARGLSDQSPLFPLLVAFLATYASVRWNHSVSSTMRAMLKSWIRSSGRQISSRVRQR